MTLAQLRTPRLVLRSFEDRDRVPFAAINADPLVMEFLPRLLTRAESDAMVDRIRQHWEAHAFGLFAVELRAGQELIGYVGLTTVRFEAHFAPNVEIAWRLSAAHWGHGYATEAASEVLRFGFEQLGLEKIVSFTVPENQRSRRVMEKLGMRYDPQDDFDHPRVPEGHRLRRHVLYRIDVAEWQQLDRAPRSVR